MARMDWEKAARRDLVRDRGSDPIAPRKPRRYKPRPKGRAYMIALNYRGSNSFMLSVHGQALASKNWRPSPKQTAWILKIYAKESQFTNSRRTARSAQL